VGLGGRLDSTNVVEPVVTCVTTIELEHTAQLGATLARIAAEKAGILATGVPAVTGDLPAEAAEVVAARAAEVGAPLAILGRDFRVEVADDGPEGLALQLADGPLVLEVRVPVHGTHQAANAALAVAGLRRAGILGDAALCDAARRGLASVALPGRVEVLSRAPWVVVDGAHTDASARALAAALARLPHRRSHLVLSLSEGKRAEAVLAALLPGADEVTLTRADAARSLAPAEIAGLVRRLAPEVALRVVPNPHLALRAARERVEDADLLCAAGSIYLAGIARRVLRHAPGGARIAVTHRVDRDPFVGA
jgi:dihydrofolate synthase/folylpolyglutamate synthase